MSSDGFEHVFNCEPQPDPRLDIETIHEARRRLFGIIFARQVEIRSFRSGKSPEDMTDEELIEAVREQEEIRKQHLSERDKRSGEFETFWSVSAMLDDMENDAIKQREQK
jgi:hypothetical protein